jgi:hypothetical protein
MRQSINLIGTLKRYWAENLLFLVLLVYVSLHVSFGVTSAEKIRFLK